jgi:hypothetical protein
VDERVDVWIVRNNGIANYFYWGFEQLSDDEIDDILERSRAVLFLAEYPSTKKGLARREEERALDGIKTGFPDADESQLHQVCPPVIHLGGEKIKWKFFFFFFFPKFVSCDKKNEICDIPQKKNYIFTIMTKCEDLIRHLYMADLPRITCKQLHHICHL